MFRYVQHAVLAVLAPRLLFFLLPMSEKHAAPAQDASLHRAIIRGTFGEYNRIYFSRDAPQGRFLGLAVCPLRKLENVQDGLSESMPMSDET